MEKSDEIIKIARKITKHLKKIKKIKAIAIGGSVVCGYPDEYSDVDIYCICNKLPSLKKRKTILDELKSDKIISQSNHPEFGFGHDIFVYRGKEVGIGYNDIKTIKNKFKEIKLRGYIHIGDYYIINQIVFQKTLWDPDKLFSKYNKKLKKYNKMLKIDAKFLWERIEDFFVNKESSNGIYKEIKRKNFIWINQLISIYIRWYLFCLYTLNNEYYHKFLTKWSYRKINEFKYKPDRCVERLEKISIMGNNKNELMKKIKIFNELIKDTSSLMKKL